MEEEKVLPLSGIKVVELGTYVAVPSATRLMAEYGAEVIKVEAPQGDEWRTAGTGQQVSVGDYNAPFFTAENSGKKLVALNTKTDAGKEALLKMIGQADVFVSNVRLKGLKKMGLDYESLKARFPKLVYCHFTGFGYDGPDAARPGFDVAAFWSRTGPLGDWVSEGTFPARTSCAFGDLTSGSMILNAILMGLMNRQLHGVGSFVTTSLYAASIWYNGNSIISAQPSFGKKFPEDPMRPGNPFTHFYRCKDGEWICLAVIGYDRMKDRLAKLFGLEDVFADPRAETQITLRETDYIVTVVEAMNRVFASKSSEEWAAILQENDLVNQVLGHLKDVATDPQALANHYVEEVEFQDNKAMMPATPIFFPELGKKGTVNMGTIGQDTDTVLADLGYSPAKIAQMRENKEIQ